MKGNETRVILYLHAVSSLEKVVVKQARNENPDDPDDPDDPGDPATAAASPTNTNNQTQNPKSLLRSLIKKVKQNPWKSAFTLLLCLLVGLLAIPIAYAGPSSPNKTADNTDLSSPGTSAEPAGLFTFNEKEVHLPNVQYINATTIAQTTTTAPATSTILKIALITAFASFGLLFFLLLIDWHLGGTAATLSRVWTRLFRAEDSKGLFHTQPYYLAISRSTCEVSFWHIQTPRICHSF